MGGLRAFGNYADAWDLFGRKWIIKMSNLSTKDVRNRMGPSLGLSA